MLQNNVSVYRGIKYFLHIHQFSSQAHSLGYLWWQRYERALGTRSSLHFRLQFLESENRVETSLSEYLLPEKPFTRKSKMESFLVNLKKDVQCSLCNQTMTEPKILECFHEFCKPCIKRNAELIGQVNIFKCPKCCSEMLLPELSDVEDLKPSPLHSRILQVLAFAESEKCCSVSASHSPALWHCFDCNRSLCDECLNSHSLFIKGAMSPGESAH